MSEIKKENKKFSVVYVVDNNRITESVSSVTAVKKLIKNISVYRVYDINGTDITGNFKKN